MISYSSLIFVISILGLFQIPIVSGISTALVSALIFSFLALQVKSLELKPRLLIVYISLYVIYFVSVIPFAWLDPFYFKQVFGTSFFAIIITFNLNYITSLSPSRKLSVASIVVVCSITLLASLYVFNPSIFDALINPLSISKSSLVLSQRDNDFGFNLGVNKVQLYLTYLYFISFLSKNRFFSTFFLVELLLLASVTASRAIFGLSPLLIALQASRFASFPSLRSFWDSYAYMFLSLRIKRRQLFLAILVSVSFLLLILVLLIYVNSNTTLYNRIFGYQENADWFVSRGIIPKRMLIQMTVISCISSVFDSNIISWLFGPSVHLCVSIFNDYDNTWFSAVARSGLAGFIFQVLIFIIPLSLLFFVLRSRHLLLFVSIAVAQLVFSVQADFTNVPASTFPIIYYFIFLNTSLSDFSRPRPRYLCNSLGTSTPA